MVSRISYEKLSEILINPDFPDSKLILEDGGFRCSQSGRLFPIRQGGIIDFVSNEAFQEIQPQSVTMVDRINEFYNRRLEQAISHSIFAVGGIASLHKNRLLKSWLSNSSGLVFDVGCGDRKLESLLPANCEYLGLDYIPVTQFSPWRQGFPHINCDALNLPLLANSCDTVVCSCVLEHVTNPERLICEIGRVVRPGGMFLLVGPGDICMSHGEPYNFFNMTRFAYKMLLEKHGFEIQEECFPAKFWTSIFLLIYLNIIRNGNYNKNIILKFLQIPILLLSLLLSPFINLLAWLMDSIIPYDKRGYFLYMVRTRKKTSSENAG